MYFLIFPSIHHQNKYWYHILIFVLHDGIILHEGIILHYGIILDEGIILDQGIILYLGYCTAVLPLFNGIGLHS